ncbi:MAG: TetR/AcrR family transcriptional regulator [Mycobacterium sp.]
MARSTPTETRRRRERGSISVDEILSGAFEVAAEVSMDNLSMPLLAKHLGVGVTSIYWYFRKKDDLLNAMTDRALHTYDFTVESIDADNWRKSLHNHAHKMRQTFRDNPVLCDLILIRGTYGMQAAHNALRKIEQPVAALVQAGLIPDDAFDTYAAIAVHVRGSVVLERLQDKMTGVRPPSGNRGRLIDRETMPLIAEVADKGHRIGVADDINFDYILDCILDHAQSLIKQQED